ncbi:MAG: hypothetical protein HC910_12045 [Spirulinaceae cyanobacterium SM2_1_0]|nr:hypothetical protein [Spirulinaceae cyanobacterium SM2_1_0]
MMSSQSPDIHINSSGSGNSLAQMALNEGQQQAKVLSQQDEPIVLYFTEEQEKILIELANILTLSAATATESAISYAHFARQRGKVLTLNPDIDLAHSQSSELSGSRRKKLSLQSWSAKIRNQLDDLEVADNLSEFVAIAIQLLHRQLTQPQPLKLDDD